MEKSLFLLVVAIYVALCCAASTKSIHKFSEEDMRGNEIFNEISSELMEEKHTALMTNDIQVSAPFPKGAPSSLNKNSQTQEERENDAEEDDDDDSDSNEYPNDQSVEKTSSSQLFNPNKAPSSKFEHMMDLFYGLCSWIYNTVTASGRRLTWPNVISF